MATNVNSKEVTGWVGWVYFAAFMLLLNGILQVVAGLAALLRDTYYVVGERALLAFDYTTWGWVHLVLGVVVICAGVALFQGSLWARIVAILLAMGNFVAQFAFIQSYPVWSITAMIIDLIVIYALTVHGGEAKADL